MVAIKFEGKEGEALKDIQQIGMDFGDRLGIKLTAQQIGNRKTGKPDGVMGHGTFAFMEQLVILAQKDSGIASEDTGPDYSRKNIELVAKYMAKQGVNEVAVSKFMTALHTIHKPESDEPTRFRKAYAALWVDHPWRIAADKLSPPIVFAGNKPAQTAPQLEIKSTFAISATGRGTTGTVGIVSAATAQQMDTSTEEFKRHMVRLDGPKGVRPTTQTPNG